jgi:phosphatidylglycerol:prolipoprotein diacylglycerol transferase
LLLPEFFNALAYLVGGAVFYWAAKTRGLATEGIGKVVVAGLIFGTLGAKLTQLVAQGWPGTLDPAIALDPRNGGRALLGGLIFGWIGVEIAKRRMGIKRSTGDLFALALPAGEAVGRIGCFFGGCCFGTECSLPWAVNQHDAWRHPAQLYSAGVAAAIFAVMLIVRKTVSLPEGGLFRIFLLCFAVSRFGLEFLRSQETFWFGLSPMQWFCLELAGTVVVLTVMARRRDAGAAAASSQGV